MFLDTESQRDFDHFIPRRLMDHPQNWLALLPLSLAQVDFRVSLGPDGLQLTTCVYCQFRRKQWAQQKLQQAQQAQHPPQHVRQPRQNPRYRSSCNQPRQPSQFGQFKTCDVCRATNKKAKCPMDPEGPSP